VSRLDLEQIIREHFARIHRAALVLAGDPWDADDLAQETFLVFARDMERFQQRSSVYTWLYGILLNLERRERRRQGTYRRKLHALSPIAEVAPAETSLEWSELRRGLWAQVARLPDGQRQAVVLRFSEGLRYEEIAALLECPLGTVKSRIYHGLLTLRRQLDRDSDLPKEPFESNIAQRGVPEAVRDPAPHSPRGNAPLPTNTNAPPLPS
jgi:RNA polymerase sigma-70 factor, ECF subfamily